MLEALYDFTPDEAEQCINMLAHNLIITGTVMDEDEAVRAAFCLFALDISNDPLTEEEINEACQKIQLYLFEGKEN